MSTIGFQHYFQETMKIPPLQSSSLRSAHAWVQSRPWLSPRKPGDCVHLVQSGSALTLHQEVSHRSLSSEPSVGDKRAGLTNEKRYEWTSSKYYRAINSGIYLVLTVPEDNVLMSVGASFTFHTFNQRDFAPLETLSSG